MVINLVCSYKALSCARAYATVVMKEKTNEKREIARQSGGDTRTLPCDVQKKRSCCAERCVACMCCVPCAMFCALCVSATFRPCRHTPRGFCVHVVSRAIGQKVKQKVGCSVKKKLRASSNTPIIGEPPWAKLCKLVISTSGRVVPTTSDTCSWKILRRRHFSKYAIFVVCAPS